MPCAAILVPLGNLLKTFSTVWRSFEKRYCEVTEGGLTSNGVFLGKIAIGAGASIPPGRTYPDRIFLRRSHCQQYGHKEALFLSEPSLAEANLLLREIPGAWSKEFFRTHFSVTHSLLIAV